MIWQLFVWCVGLIFFSGMGLCVEQILLWKRPNSNFRLKFFDSVWMGIIGSLAIAHLVSLFFPINGYTTATLLACSLYGLGNNRSSGTFLDRLPFKETRWYWNIVLFALVFVCWTIIAFECRFSISLSDTEIYHYNVVRWITDYPAIPGLVNLKHQLAFNNAFHIFAALFEAAFLRDRSAHFALGFLAATATAHWLSIICGDKQPSRLRISSLVCLVFVSIFCFNDDPASLSADSSTAFIVMIMITYSIIGGFQNTLIAAMLAVTASTFKPIALPSLVYGITLFFIEAYLPRSEFDKAQKKLLIIKSAAIVGFLFFIHMIRGVILNGHLFFPLPFSFLNLHLPWSTTDALTSQIYRAIVAWARDPRVSDVSIVLDRGFLAWYLPWQERNWGSYLPHIMGLAGFTILTAGALKFWKFLDRELTLKYILATGFSSACALAWYVTVPDPRFGLFYPILVIAICSGLAFSRGHTIWRIAAAIAAVISIVRAPIYFSHYQRTRYDQLAASWLALSPKDPPGPNMTIARFDNPKMLPYMYHSASYSPCTNSPVPCFYSPYELPMRDPPNIEKGFLPAATDH